MSAGDRCCQSEPVITPPILYLNHIEEPRSVFTAANLVSKARPNLHCGLSDITFHARAHNFLATRNRMIGWQGVTIISKVVQDWSKMRERPEIQEYGFSNPKRLIFWALFFQSFQIWAEAYKSHIPGGIFKTQLLYASAQFFWRFEI
jgi:hypothetical protein